MSTNHLILAGMLGIAAGCASPRDAPQAHRLDAGSSARDATVADFGHANAPMFLVGFDAAVCDDAAIPDDDKCSISEAIHVGDCNFELLHRLPRDAACAASVSLDEQTLECNGPDGWESPDALHIRLLGSACARLRAGEVTSVRVEIPCHPIGIEPSSC